MRPKLLFVTWLVLLSLASAPQAGRAYEPEPARLERVVIETEGPLLRVSGVWSVSDMERTVHAALDLETGFDNVFFELTKDQVISMTPDGAVTYPVNCGAVSGFVSDGQQRVVVIDAGLLVSSDGGVTWANKTPWQNGDYRQLDKHISGSTVFVLCER